MGVVKNLMVRIGANVTGVVQGMRAASSATSQAKDSIQKSTKNIKQAVSSGFSGVMNSVAAYSETLENTRQAHEVAKQNVGRLKDKLTGLRDNLTTAESLLTGLDMKSTIADQAKATEKEIEKLGNEIATLKEQLDFWDEYGGSRTKGVDLGVESKRKEMKDLIEKSDQAVMRLQELEHLSETLGKGSEGTPLRTLLQSMREELSKTENQLKTTQKIADETGSKLSEMGSTGGYLAGLALGRVGQMLKGIGTAALSKTVAGLKSIGSAASSAAVSGARKLGNALKNLAGGVVRGIVSLPGKLLRIGKAATSGSGGVKRLVQQIRNIGVVSLGMRVAGSIFGRLRSIISNYLSTNDELNAATSLLTKQMGQALEPAIRLVITAMQQLMPVVQKVSAGVNAVLKAIIGEVGNVQYAFRQLGTYGFDQITKSDEEETGSSTETAQSALVQKLVGWIDELKKAFTAGDWRKLGKLVGNGINSVFDAINAVDVGKKIGTFTNNLFTTLHSVFTTVDFAGIGKTAATLLNEAVGQIDWNIVGETIGYALLAVPTILEGFVTGADWEQMSRALTRCLDGVFSVINRIDVIGKIGKFAGNLVNTLHGVFTGIDFAGIGRTTAQLLNEAIRQIDWAKAGEIIGKALVAIPDILVGFVLETDWAKVGKSASECVRTALTIVTEWLKTTDWLEIGKSAAELIGNTDWGGIASDLFAGLGAALGAGVSLLWGALEGVVTSIKDYFGEKIEEAGGKAGLGFLNGIVEGLGNIGKWISENIAEPFKEGFRGLGNGVVDVVEDMVNSIISGLNELFSAISAVFSIAPAGYAASDMPIINSVSLPRAARGGIVDGPTQLIAGEKGKEAIVPLENNTQWIDKVADKVNARVTGGGGNQPMIVQIFLGKRKLTEYLIQDINQITQETGVCPIKV